MKGIRTVGIIGLGSFGRFTASLLLTKQKLTLRAYDTDSKPMTGVHMEPLEVVAASDVVVIAVPLESYDEILPQVAKHIRPETLLIDICSVKVYPERLIAKYLPEHRNVLLTHPLFGPQSAADSVVGHKLIVTKSEGDTAEQILDMAEQSWELDVHRMTADDHDQLMARVHVLTFFVARGLSNLDLKKGPFVTPSYDMIMDLVVFDHTHSDELFQTIQAGNPYADTMRQQVVKSFVDLEASLSKTKHDE